MKRSIVILLTIITISCTAQDNVITSIDLDTFTKAVIGKKVQLIDIRTPDEYHAGYIDDAININSADETAFIKAFQQLDKTQPIFIYCHSGWRSHRAGKKLATMGFQKIYDFKGGYKAWSAR